MNLPNLRLRKEAIAASSAASSAALTRPGFDQLNTGSDHGITKIFMFTRELFKRSEMRTMGLAQRSPMAPYFAAGCTFRAIRLVVILVAICLAFSVPASAQFDTGTIAGSITDPSGAVIPQATVTITNVDTSIQTTVQSDSGGSFVASALPFGHYVVSATASGFSKAGTKPLEIGRASCRERV